MACGVGNTLTGLSPRVRGNHRVVCDPLGNRRSIPACAGEPRRDEIVRLFDAVYPRVCGGTPALIPRSSAATGLSPRVRGNPT